MDNSKNERRDARSQNKDLTSCHSGHRERLSCHLDHKLLGKPITATDYRTNRGTETIWKLHLREKNRGDKEKLEKPYSTGAHYCTGAKNAMD